MSAVGMLGSFTVLAGSTTDALNKTKDNDAIQRSQYDSATRNPALVSPNDPTGVNSNTPGARPVNPGGVSSPVNPSGASSSGPSGVNPSNPAGTSTGSGY
ncbi:MAG: hypothetical protein H0X02_00640 [Nitrosomonas sp.]|nr:hypothetical protein [Nitrosomonas sp.]